MVGDLVQDVQILTFKQIGQDCNIPPGLLPTYGQLLVALRSLWGALGEELPTHAVIHILYVMEGGRHLITWLYKAVREHTHIPLVHLRHIWEEVLTRPLHDTDQVV